MDVTYAITGALTAKLNGQTMIKKNEIYFYEFYCLDNNKYMTEIVIALQDEFPITDEYLSRFSIDEALQDVVNVLFRNTVKTVLITELYEIGT
tara:strand:- start:635 stop:913 length:279 start_codon:yes stop_codon:yes gene_type:complete